MVILRYTIICILQKKNVIVFKMRTGLILRKPHVVGCYKTMNVLKI